MLALGLMSGAYAECSERGEYVCSVKPWTDPIRPSVFKLDSGDLSFNLWRGLVDPADWLYRYPGLIDIHRCRMMTQAGGIKTFLARPITVTPEDLTVANVDAAIFCRPINAQMNAASGGDHLIPYEMIIGIADAIGKRRLALVHFDANIDIGKHGLGLRFVVAARDR